MSFAGPKRFRQWWRMVLANQSCLPQESGGIDMNRHSVRCFQLFAAVVMLSLTARAQAQLTPTPATPSPNGAPVTQAPAQPTTPSPDYDTLSALYGRPLEDLPSERLAGIPNMFGDFPAFGPSLTLTGPAGTAVTDLPLAGGARRMKAAENNQALPQDRVYTLYNHYTNAYTTDASAMIAGPASRNFDVDRYTFGFEKTFANCNWSVEVRMPLAGTTELTTPNFSMSGGEVGNLQVLVKRLLISNECTAISAGLAIDTPTGSDVEAIYQTNRFLVRNESVHLMPFVAFTRKPNDCLFYHAFFQMDVATNNNRVENANGATLGTLNDQTLLFADVGMGYWIYRNYCGCRRLTGVAAILEYHYTTTTQDAGTMPPVNITATRAVFGGRRNRSDISNVTAGLHAEFCCGTVGRVGVALPLETDQRAFDAELLLQLEQRF